MKNKTLEKVLHVIIELVAAFIIAAVGFWVIGSALQEGEGNVQSQMNDRANFVAKCKSVEGVIGGDKCYVNGGVVFSKYGTAQVYNERETIQPELVKAIQANFEKHGVDVEEVYLQEVRYPDNVVQSFANAQAARAEVETAKAQQDKAKIEAETNKIKSTALTDAVLKEKLIDALKNGKGTYIIDTNNISIGVK